MFTLFSDPGHGWLRVPKNYLFDLGIAEKISQYSYQSGKWAYLEEDCDLEIFIKAIGFEKWAIIRESLKQKNSINESSIRSFARFYPQPYREIQTGDKLKISGFYQPITVMMTRPKFAGIDDTGKMWTIPKNRIQGFCDE